MTADFLPEYCAVPTSKGWRPSVKRFVGKPEKLVPYPDGPRYFATSDEAKEAAKEYMRSILNTRIESEQIAQEIELTEIEKWRREKAEQAEAEKLRVFGSKGPAIVRDFKGNEVKVERRRARCL